MKTNKKPLHKVSEKKLDWLLEKQNTLKKIPENRDLEIQKLLKEKAKTYQIKNESNTIGVFFNQYKFQFSAAIAAVIILPVIIFSIIYFNINSQKTKLSAKSVKIKGDVKITSKNKEIQVRDTAIFKEKDIVITEKNSNIEMMIGESTSVLMESNSKLTFNLLNKKEKNENTVIYLQKGMVECSVNLPSNKSSFKIITDLAEVRVTGTKFTVKVLDNNDLKLDVEEGTVEISNILKNRKGKKIEKINDKEILEKISSIADSKIMIKENETILLEDKTINKINISFNKLIDESLNNKHNAQNKKSIMKSLNKMKQESFSFKVKKMNNNELSEETIDVKEYQTVNKIINLNILFEETDTYVSSNNKNIYIASGRNKSIYCINPLTGKIKWQFKNEKLKSITSPGVYYKGNIILPTPDNLFSINNGKLINQLTINEGTSYWAVSKIINNTLYIPGFRNIYKYENNKISILENFPDSNGQLYISNYKNNLFANCLNEKIIKAYDLDQKIIFWESNKLIDRSFISPLVIGNNIYTADRMGNIYKYNYKSGNKAPLVLKNNTGIMTEMIYKNGFIYFAAMDGYLYKCNTSNFKSFNKIIKIENNPNSDKYLVKNILLVNNHIFFNSDTGKLFKYNTDTKKSEFIIIKDNSNNNPLISTPVKIDNNIYTIDSKSNLYKVSK